MINNIKNLGVVLNKSTQESIKGGNPSTDCMSHRIFCDNAHPTDNNAFWDCVDSCNCSSALY